MAFFNRCVTRGAEMFDDTADNMTGMVVYINPKGIKKVDAPAGLPSKSPARQKDAESGDPSRFSV